MSISTTLITFLLRAPNGTFAVELFGSWDNFSKPYKLSQDRRTGDNNWRGCHFFEGITCDGDTSDLSAMRNGGLMMGGKYWYYYLLNTTTEYHDPEEPFTSSCPLLPGQPVNILDVPMQPPKTYSGNDSSESLDSLVFTLDPRDKYLLPGVRRAFTTSAIQQRKTFLPQTLRMPLNTTKGGCLEPESQIQTPCSTRDGPTLRPQRSLISIFEKLRRTKSAGSSNLRATTSWHRKVLSRAGSRAGLRSGLSKKATPVEDVPAVPQVPAYILGASKCDSANTTPAALNGPAISEAVDPTIPLVHAIGHLALPPRNNNQICNESPEALTNQEERGQKKIPNTSLLGKFGAPSRPKYVLTHVREPKTTEEYHSKREIDYSKSPETIVLSEGGSPNSRFHAAAAAFRSPILQEQTLSVGETSPAPPNENLGPMEHGDPTSSFECADSSYATEENFSPNIASRSTQSGPTSPFQLSQPETPVMSDFEDDAVSWRRGSDLLDLDVAYMKPPLRAPPLPPTRQQPMFLNPFKNETSQTGYQAYSTSHDEHGSTHTILKSPSMTLGHPQHSSHHQTSSKEMVHSWDDGSGHRMTALEEMVDELGYLGAFIE